MDANSGTYFYRFATGLAGLVAAVLSYFLNADRGMPIISAAALSLAGFIWLADWAGRHMLVGR